MVVRGDLGARVAEAAEQALNYRKYVSAVDVLTGMGLLQPIHLEQWRRGQVPYLEKVIQGNLNKLSESLRLFRNWAEARGLKPSVTVYTTQGRGEAPRPLPFSGSADPTIARAYRTILISPELNEKKQR